MAVASATNKSVTLEESKMLVKKDLRGSMKLRTHTIHAVRCLALQWTVQDDRLQSRWFITTPPEGSVFAWQQ
jgi:hypothetical protein